MARPRSGKEKHRPRHLGLRVAAWVHDAVHRLAAEHDQPASDIAHELLEIALGQLGITQSAVMLDEQHRRRTEHHART